MEEVNLSNLNISLFENFTGSFSMVNKCELEGKTYAYKYFTDKNYFKKRINKIKALSNMNLDNCILPLLMVYDDIYTNDYVGYLTDYFEGMNIGIIRSKENKIEILCKLKETIINMNHNGIIHGDLHFGNILTDKNSNYRIIDFDNCNYKRYKIRENDASDFASLYIKEYGINEDLDRYLFNLLTFCVLNGTYYFEVRKNVMKKQYGIFGDDESCKRICDSLFLENDKYDFDFLIDAYQKKLK